MKRAVVLLLAACNPSPTAAPVVSAAPSVSAAPASSSQPSATNSEDVRATPPLGRAIVRRCAPSQSEAHAWPVTVAELETVAARLGQGYCAKKEEVAKMLGECARTRASGLVAVEAEVEGRSACNLEVQSFAWQERRWIRVTAFVGIGGEFHSETEVFELRGAAFEPYYAGYSGNTDLCDPSLPPELGKDADTRMRTDWPTLPPEVRAFLCG